MGNRRKFQDNEKRIKARPVYLSRDDRIIAHFTTCFLSLVLHRYLEKELNEKYTATEIIDTLRNMNLTKNCDEGYIPSYTRTDITDCLHEKFNFRTDYEIMKNIEIKKILNFIKKQFKYAFFCQMQKAYKIVFIYLTGFFISKKCQI